MAALGMSNSAVAELTSPRCLQDRVSQAEPVHESGLRNSSQGSTRSPRGSYEIKPRTQVNKSVVFDSVVKLYVTHCEPNYSLPWQMQSQAHTTSTGFVLNVEKRLIFSNAHSVEHSTVVKVKKRGSAKKYIARVLEVGPECDLSLITVEDDNFWEGVEAIPPGPLPALQDAVAVVGFPIGGVNISVTAGVVSRVDMQRYSHAGIELLCIQIDAAINSGNSGGPALNANCEVIGIAFQSLASGDAENIGFIIPWLVVEHFLADYEKNGHSTGFPYCGFTWQKMENKYLRESMMMIRDSDKSTTPPSTGTTETNVSVVLHTPESTPPPSSSVCNITTTSTTPSTTTTTTSSRPTPSTTGLGSSGSRAKPRRTSKTSSKPLAPVATVAANSSKSSSTTKPASHTSCAAQTAIRRSANRHRSKSSAGATADSESGILIKRVDVTSEAVKILRKGDVVTHFERTPIADDGTVSYHTGERISFHYLVTLKYVGEVCSLRILRDGVPREVSYALPDISSPYLVPVHEKLKRPEYLIIAGLVFVVLTEPYLVSQYGVTFTSDAPVKLIEKWALGFKKNVDKQVVLISQVLNAEVNTGYEHLANRLVLKFNGQSFANLRQLAQLIEESDSGHLRFDLDYDDVIILGRKDAMAATEKILTQHAIPTNKYIAVPIE